MSDYDGMFIKPKIHTLRFDPKDRWKAGRDIHFAINSRTKNYFQFAPVIPCVSVQKVRVKYIVRNGFDMHGEVYSSSRTPTLSIDNFDFYNPEIGIDKGMKQLAINDGFDSVEDFFAYFNEDCTLKLIHWADLKY